MLKYTTSTHIGFALLERGRNMSRDRGLDCSSLSENSKCTWLTVYNCQGEECTFKRTCKEYNDSFQFAHQRLATLDSSTQSHIAKKYYGGSMPWNKKAVMEDIVDISV